jgi:hypothetical protein
MSYEEAMEAEVTKEEARREILRHGHDAEDFFREVGDRATYAGSEVLGWLGY